MAMLPLLCFHRVHFGELGQLNSLLFQTFSALKLNVDCGVTYGGILYWVAATVTNDELMSIFLLIVI